jgi:hypothetical protein
LNKEFIRRIKIIINTKRLTRSKMISFNPKKRVENKVNHRVKLPQRTLMKFKKSHRARCSSNKPLTNQFLVTDQKEQQIANLLKEKDKESELHQATAEEFEMTLMDN